MINIFNNKKNVDNKEVILHAKNGKKIYARTLNQLKIVNEIEIMILYFLMVQRAQEKLTRRLH